MARVSPSDEANVDGWPRRAWRAWSAVLPDACLMPLHSVLLTVLLLSGLLPLFFYTVNFQHSQASDFPLVCGLYPDVDWAFEPDGVTRLDLAAPPAPPGARDITTPAGCKDDFGIFADYGRDYEVMGASPWLAAPVIFFSIMIESLDPQMRSASVRFTVKTGPAFAGVWNQVRLPEGVVLSIAYNGGEADEYADGDVFGDFTATKLDVAVRAESDLSNYPFDSYRLALEVDLKFINMSDGNSTSFVPFVAAMRVRSPAFSFVAPVGSDWTYLGASGSSFGFDFTAQRTSSTKGFSIFVFLAMWVLSIFCVVHAIDLVYWRKRPFTLEVPAFSATLLFALPAVRQVQPGVPDVGAVIDMVGFFWNMVLLAIVCCLLLAAIYAQARHELGRLQQHQEAAAAAAGGGAVCVSVQPPRCGGGSAAGGGGGGDVEGGGVGGYLRKGVASCQLDGEVSGKVPPV